MPELLEVEAYRRLFAARALRRRIADVEAPDPWYLKAGLTARVLADALVGARFESVVRRGKLLLAPSDRGPTLALRFGMTGRLVVDGRAGVDRLLYSSERTEARWDRLVVHFADGGDLRVRDPRRLGGVLLDPELASLGPDATAVTPEEVRELTAASRAPLKALLMNQARLAGLGNLLSDEVLWRARLDPARPARSLDGAECRRLHRAIRQTLEVLGRRGGSHTGTLQPHRLPGGRCPRCGTELVRRAITGRTSWSCPRCQQ